MKSVRLEGHEQSAAEQVSFKFGMEEQRSEMIMKRLNSMLEMGAKRRRLIRKGWRNNAGSLFQMT